jgi:threonine dehydratase
MTSRHDIDAAWARIAPHVRITPTLRLNRGQWGFNNPTWLKLELTQVAGSFKGRGAFNQMLSQPVPASGVIAASGGNHGIATAYAARELGVRAEIFVPTISSPVKQQKLRELGAVLTVTGDNYYGALDACVARQKETGALDIHAYNKPATIAGQGTCGRELDQQVPDLDTVLVACGGGGFIGGIAAWYANTKTRVVSVEPETSQCLAAALHANARVMVPVGGVAADSLGASMIGELAWDIVRKHVAAAVTVSDDAIVAAQRALWSELRTIAEPGGATALAALLSGAYVPAPDERVAVLVCGGNAGLATFA